MPEYETSLATARQRLKQADHIVSVTYPLLKDPRLLLSSLDSMFGGVTAAMKALLQFERSRHRIPIYGDSFASQYNLFATRVVPTHHINKKYVQFIAHLKEFLDHHRKASVEFRKKDAFVMADDDYEMRTLTPQVIKEQLSFAKMFISEVALLIMDEKESELEKVSGP